MSRLVDIGKEVLEKEARAILQVMERLNDDFDRAVNAINAGRGRVVFSGIGKSGLIAKKIASTFSSVGIPSIYLHPCGFAPRGPRHRAEGGHLFHHLEQRGNGRGDKDPPVDKENGHS